MTSRSHRLHAVALGVVITLVLSTLSVVAAGDVAAPSVEMRNAEGARIRLADFRGKVVLVKLWASWCPDCQAAFPRLDALQREFRSRGVEVIAVSVDESKKDVERFLETRPHQLNVMFDPRARVLDAFGASGVPTSYLIDRRGIIRYSHEGYDAATEAAYRRELETLIAEPLS